MQLERSATTATGALPLDLDSILCTQMASLQAAP